MGAIGRRAIGRGPLIPGHRQTVQYCANRIVLARCARILASATTVFHRCKSLDTTSLKSLGVPSADSLPSVRMRCTTSGSVICALVSALSRATKSAHQPTRACTWMVVTPVHFGEPSWPRSVAPSRNGLITLRTILRHASRRSDSILAYQLFHVLGTKRSPTYAWIIWPTIIA
jgi:hypothetical protein